MMNTISILGSTGSIGRQTLDVAEQLGLQVAALTANSNVERMEAQCRKFRPRLAVMTEEAAAKELAIRLQDTSVKVLAGTDALVDAAVIPEAETVVTAVVGMVGLKATLAAIREKKRIALANKETLVCAGELVMSEADRCGAEIVPVDSEHSAIFQCLQGCADRREIRRLILTCSGGPFRGMGRDEVGRMTRADALRHRIAPGDEDIGDSSPAVQKQQKPHGNTLYLPLGDPQYHSHQADDTDDKGNNEDGYLQLAGAGQVVQHCADAPGQGIQCAESH